MACFRYSLKELKNCSKIVWTTALRFTLIANIGYYVALVVGVKYAGAEICTLMTGIAPLTIAFYGNWLKNEGKFSKLLLPAALILLGLFIVNWDLFITEAPLEFSSDYLLGFSSVCVSLTIWTWYVVANAKFLRSHPEVSYFDWSTLLGVSTFLWVLLIAGSSIFLVDRSQLVKFFTWNSDLQLFFIITAVLGCICSWLGFFLWNSGCTYLPISLSGQLTILESVFGIIFVYLIEQRFPEVFELVGVSLMLLAVAYSITLFKKTGSEPMPA